MVANGANGDFNPVSKNQRNIKIKLDHLPIDRDDHKKCFKSPPQ